MLLAACASTAPMRQPPIATALEAQASAGPLAFADGRVENGQRRLCRQAAAGRRAKHSLDLAYYIFDDDYSSSRLSQALIDAAKRGVKVRLLVDYFSAYGTSTASAGSSNRVAAASKCASPIAHAGDRQRTPPS